MIDLATSSERDRVLRVMNSRNPAAGQDWECWVGPKPLKRSTLDLSFGRDKDGIPQVLDTTLGAPLDKKLRGKTVTLDLVVGGVPITRYTGRALKIKRAGRRRSRLKAVTQGWWLDRKRLEADTAYQNAVPREVALSILGRLEYLGPDVIVADVRTPLFTRQAGEAYRSVDPLRRVLDDVSGETGMVFFDTRLGGHRALVPPPAAYPGDPVATFRLGEDLDEEETFTYEETDDEWRDVVVWRAKADGSTEDLQRVDIPGSAAPEGVSYQIEVSDSSPLALANALYEAQTAATNLIMGMSTGQLVLPYYPALLEEMDAIVVVEPDEDDEDWILRHWLCRIDAINGVLPEKTATLDWTGVTLREERTPKRAHRRAGRPSHRVIAPKLGRDHRARPRVHSSLSWVLYDPATGRVTLDAFEAARQGVFITRQTATTVRVRY